MAAGRARYVGSPEHKDAPSFAGHPRPRADASICDQSLSQDEVGEWLRHAIETGSYSSYWEGGFPRYVWYKRGEIVYEARLINREAGDYKGWPLHESEWPLGVMDLYE